MRAARQLRGSALMARHPAIAEVAGALEGVARSFQAGRVAWVGAARETTEHAIEGLRTLVRRIRDWTADDEARAGELVALLASLGSPALPPRPPVTSAGDLDAGVRAFIAREGALIASYLDQAARLLDEARGQGSSALEGATQRMAALRGVAGLGELTPIPEILEGIDLLAQAVRTPASVPGAEQLAEAAARALSRASRDVADRGRPERDAPEARAFATLLTDAFLYERDVVPMEQLLAGALDAPGAHPRGRVAPGAVELTGYAESLQALAGVLEQPPSALGRDLRLIAAAGMLRDAAGNSEHPLARALGRLGQLLRTRAAASEYGALADLLHRAAAALRGTLPAESMATVLDQLVAPAPAAAVATAAIEQPSGVAEEDAAGPIVPITALEFDDEPTALERSFSTYHRLLTTEPEVPATLAGLAGVPAAPVIALTPPPVEEPEPAVPAAAAFELATEAEAPEPVVAVAAPAAPPMDDLADVVPIETLLYRGRAALLRAQEVRAELMLRQQAGHSADVIAPLLDELLDLVPLALDDA